MLLELLIFGAFMVVGNVLATLFMFKYVAKKLMDKDFVKGYTKAMLEVTQEVTEEFLEKQ